MVEAGFRKLGFNHTQLVLIVDRILIANAHLLILI